jgi:6-phosphogluconate dehydrogenase (decarboxylating)
MALLERPRRILMMVPAGPPVDSVIAHLGRILSLETSSSTVVTRCSATPIVDPTS